MDFSKVGDRACKNAINSNNDSVVSSEGHKNCIVSFHGESLSASGLPIARCGSLLVESTACLISVTHRCHFSQITGPELKYGTKNSERSSERSFFSPSPHELFITDSGTALYTDRIDVNRKSVDACIYSDQIIGLRTASGGRRCHHPLPRGTINGRRRRKWRLSWKKKMCQEAVR